jgi:hypothetical protein
MIYISYHTVLDRTVQYDDIPPGQYNGVSARLL